MPSTKAFTFSDTYLLKNMEEWLAPYLTGVNSLRGCQNLDLKNILLGQLSTAQATSKTKKHM